LYGGFTKAPALPTAEALYQLLNQMNVDIQICLPANFFLGKIFS